MAKRKANSRVVVSNDVATLAREIFVRRITGSAGGGRTAEHHAEQALKDARAFFSTLDPMEMADEDESAGYIGHADETIEDEATAEV